MHGLHQNSQDLGGSAACNFGHLPPPPYQNQYKCSSVDECHLRHIGANSRSHCSTYAGAHQASNACANGPANSQTHSKAYSSPHQGVQPYAPIAELEITLYVGDTDAHLILCTALLLPPLFFRTQEYQIVVSEVHVAPHVPHIERYASSNML